MFYRLLTIFLLLGTAAHAQQVDPAMGITSEQGGTRVRVWAPNAKSVSLVGDFNNWHAMGSEKLAPEGNSGIWSTFLKRSIPKGSYRFLINDSLQRRDPYARATTPDGQASLFYSPREFDWKDDKAPTYPLNELVIYEMHVGAFFDPDPRDGKLGTFADAVKRLDHLQELGINVVELLPIHEFAGNHSWGYNPSDPFSVEQAYGGPEAFKAFVRECHKRGIAVHLDIVHNHYDQVKASLLQFDGTGQPNSGGIYFYDQPGLDKTPWGPRPRFDEKMVRRYIRDNAMMWLEEYRVDGFRWDSTVNIRAYNDGRNPIPAGAKMLEDINTEIKKRHTNVFSIAEDSLGIGNFHASWDYGFHNTVIPELKKADDQRNLATIGRALKAQSSMPRVVYVDNHDEAGKLNGQTRFASDIDPANPGSAKARQMSGIGALLTLTAPGIPLLFMGNEFLESGPFHEDRILDWGKRQRFAGLVALNRDLIRLRRNLDGVGNALTGNGIDIQLMDETKKVMVYWRWHERSANERMVIAINFTAQPQTDIPILFPSAGPWITKINTDWTRYGGDTREDEGPVALRSGTHRTTISLPPYSAQVFVRKVGPGLPRPALDERPTPDAAPAAPPPVVENVHFASIRLMGEDGTGKPFAQPLKQIGPVHWEAFLNFTNVDDGALRLLADRDGKVFWGQAYDNLDRLPYKTTMDRKGSDVQIATMLNGTYRVRFNAQTREFFFEAPPAGTTASPESASESSAPLGPFRTWTDVRGKTIQAKLIAATSETVTLESPSGKRVEIKLEILSAEDQDFARKEASRLAP
ncbi:MAG: alpha amylase C-terminal domain-containing protein [Kiritimatiellae bacterium]|nr:alpha amylase C-terminal domain-containing protein [Kiritimatiellia bacterium]MCO5068922.1 alpha-amylase family glycosyl hydrolase [Kiritimatiellia bacterium]